VQPMVYNLLDTSFAHDLSSVAGVTCDFIKWDRDWSDPTRPLFVTNEAILKPPPQDLYPSARYGLLIESAAIIPSVYRRAPAVIDRFDQIFTHNSKLLAMSAKCRWIPGGGIWIGGRHAGGSLGVFDKARLCSMLTSRKTITRLHRRRLAIALRLARKQHRSVDVFIDPGQPYSFEVLQSYRYNICIENNIDEGYFTERLLNCFATGTIPIYMGATQLKDYFNMAGVLTFRNRRELERILSWISTDDYESRLPAIYENFQRVLRYRSIEDFISLEYLST